ncbi:MAG: TlyA family RNA methyltransferase, partial [Elusimicrobiota bacterium]|nr:TlyA family RNA methyltransferase [Elusimicrobiota bacterium]
MKNRIDKILTQQGLVETRAKAQKIIKNFGVKVEGQLVNDPSKVVNENSKIDIVKSYEYVSAGGYKLEGLLDTGIINVKDKICFDIGSSTGGFVDCLLKFGAKKVYCCDVGKGLLHEKLRKDARVVLFEGVNFRYFIELGYAQKVKDKIDIFTVDVSFISLTKILPVIKNIANYPHTIAALVKPQFECEPKYVKKGVVKEEKYRLEAVQKIINFAQSNLGYKHIFTQESKVKGKEGNIEYFVV